MRIVSRNVVLHRIVPGFGISSESIFDFYACSGYVMRLLSRYCRFHWRTTSTKQQIPSKRTRIHVSRVVVKVRNTDQFSVVALYRWNICRCRVRWGKCIEIFSRPLSYLNNTMAAQDLARNERVKDGYLNRTLSSPSLFRWRGRRLGRNFK